MDYILGLQLLKRSLPPEMLNEFLVYEARLMENLHEERLYGGSTSAARMKIVDQLNRLASEYCNISFTEMCHRAPTQALQINTVVTSSVIPETFVNKDSQEEQVPAPSPAQRVASPQVRVHLLTTIIPTAYYQQLAVEEFPLVTVHIDNTGLACDDTALSVRAFIEDYSDTAVGNIAVAKGEQKSISLLPILKPEALEKLNDIRWATLHTIIHQTLPTKQELPGSGTHRVALHARNTALLEEEKDGEVIDLARYLAAWVTPHHPSIDALLHQAHVYNKTRAFDGYQGNVEEQVRAIFTALKQGTQLDYTDSYRNIGTAPHQYMQKIRLPSESLAVGMANCLDGAVLFASLLESIAIDPVLLVVPEHAVVGWRVLSDDEQYSFLDTTLIGLTDFVEARQKGDRIFNTYSMYQDRALFDSDGFARLIDVAECREQGIYPLQ